MSVGEHSFAQMEDDVDRQKLLGQPSHQRVGQPVTDIDHLTLQVQVNIVQLLRHTFLLSLQASKAYRPTFAVKADMNHHFQLTFVR